MFLKYCPDSLNHLFDRCLIKPCMGQVGEVLISVFHSFVQSAPDSISMYAFSLEYVQSPVLKYNVVSGFAKPDLS
jgi:hypothetical protein